MKSYVGFASIIIGAYVTLKFLSDAQQDTGSTKTIDYMVFTAGLILVGFGIHAVRRNVFITK